MTEGGGGRGAPLRRDCVLKDVRHRIALTHSPFIIVVGVALLAPFLNFPGSAKAAAAAASDRRDVSSHKVLFNYQSI